MTVHGVARYQLTFLVDDVFPVLERVIDAIPPDRLDFRATPELMSARELAAHVYQGAYVLGRALESGVFSLAVLDEIPFAPERVTEPREIVAYGRRVRDYVAGLRDRVSDGRLAEPTRAGVGPVATGEGCLAVMVQEAVHHRAQLMIYLRLMGVRPPGIYGNGEGRADHVRGC